MTPNKFSGRVVFLTMVSLLFVALSLSMPWYRVEYSGEYVAFDDVRVVSGEYTFYTDLVFNGEYYDEYLDPFQENPVGNLMGIETLLMEAWVAVGCLFVLAVLLDGKFWSILFGGTMLVIGMLAVLLFVGWMDDAVVSSEYYYHTWGVVPEPDEFWVRMTSDTGFAEFAPMQGFWMVVAAVLMQLIAVPLRFSVSVEKAVQELRTMWSAPPKPSAAVETAAEPATGEPKG